nr:MAG: gag protein [Bat faecal associated retrovirus 1]
MGQVESQERQIYSQMLQSMLSSRGVKVSAAQIERFLKFVHEQCPWFPEEGTVSPETWERVGKRLKDFHAGNPTRVPVDAFSLWSLVRDVLGSSSGTSIRRTRSLGSLEGENSPFTSLRPDSPDLPAPKRVAREPEEKPKKAEPSSPDDDDGPFPALTEQGIEKLRLALDEIQKTLRHTGHDYEYMSPVFPPDTQAPTAPYPLVPPPPPTPMPLPGAQPLVVGFDPQDAPRPLRTPLEEALFKARERGEEELGIPMTFPVVENPDPNNPGGVLRTHVPFPLKTLKELKMACAQYGTTAPFTLSLIETLSVEAITPSDWRAICRAILTGGDYLLWKSEFQEFAAEQARRNRRTNQNPNQNWGYDMLLGEGAYATTDMQIRYPQEVYVQINQCAVKAWKKLPSGKRTEELAKIVQGPDERYQDFVSRLLQAVGRVVSDGEAGTLLVQQLAFENANTACKAILRPYYRKGTLEDYIRLCSDVGPSYMQGLALAAALKETTIEGLVKAQQMKSKLTCFGCGKPGHMKKQCPQGTRMKGKMKKKPSGPCPRCGKGNHWANECRSKVDRFGNPLPGNYPRGLAPARQTIGAISLQQGGVPPLTNREMEVLNHRSRSPNSTGLPPVVQDWI